mmetsp:Transcript_101345/g.325688  ORF Transcript_101345/g.325688 Transcript_101345/m.325688 type:complete len:219 (-) Transcript_101345:1872-2528(-)
MFVPRDDGGSQTPKTPALREQRIVPCIASRGEVLPTETPNYGSRLAQSMCRPDRSIFFVNQSRCHQTQAAAGKRRAEQSRDFFTLKSTLIALLPSNSFLEELGDMSPQHPDSIAQGLALVLGRPPDKHNNVIRDLLASNTNPHDEVVCTLLTKSRLERNQASLQAPACDGYLPCQPVDAACQVFHGSIDTVDACLELARNAFNALSYPITTIGRHSRT